MTRRNHELIGETTSPLPRPPACSLNEKVNNTGKPRLTKFFNHTTPSTRTSLIDRIYTKVSSRPDALCNFLELDPSHVVVYRHYATLYFVVVVDRAESELAILDLIQVCH